MPKRWLRAEPRISAGEGRSKDVAIRFTARSCSRRSAATSGPPGTRRSSRCTLAAASVWLSDRTRVEVADTYCLDADGVLHVKRSARIVEVGNSGDVRIGLTGTTAVAGAAEQEWQVFLPGT